MNCPNCGLKEFPQSQRELLINCLKEVTGKHVYYCNCSQSQKEEAKKQYWKANDISKRQSTKLDDLSFKVWWLHHQPDMRDCREMNYGYRVINNKVVCEAGGDYIDITDEVTERFDTEHQKKEK